MTVESPNLDDLRYNRVLQDLVRRIPVYTPTWTNHNDSDPGVALLQLFAYLTEQIGYRLNQVPEKNHIELLKLLGVRLQPARSARTMVAFFLANPKTLPGFVLDAGSRVTKSGDNAPIFETDHAIDIVPAEPAVIVATKNPYITDLLRLDAVGNREPEPTDPQLPAENPGPTSTWHSVTWDGDKPQAKEMARSPIVRLPEPDPLAPLRYLWIGLESHPGLDAGFVGVTVKLHIALDDDEIPDARSVQRCEPAEVVGQLAPPPIDWLAYYDADAGDVRNVGGRIRDTTSVVTRSGFIEFTVPLTAGPIPADEFADLRDAVTPSPVDACADIATSLKAKIAVPSGGGDALFDPAGFHAALTGAVTAAQSAVAQTKPAVAHPLDPELRDPTKVGAWLRLGPLPLDPSEARIRYIGFNAVGATHAITVTNEIVGRSDGRPGQLFKLAHGNVMDGTLELAVAESPDDPLTTWSPVDSLDGAGPNDRVFAADLAAGLIEFGSGDRGRVPPLAANAGEVVALRYRHGGGRSGNSAMGELRTLATQHVGLKAVVNFASARGGAEAEALQEAKIRARKELSTRHRAVTSGDFEWITLQTPDVEVARAIVVPLRRPLPDPSNPLAPPVCDPPPTAPPPGPDRCAPPGLPHPDHVLHAGGPAPCGPPLPEAPAGLQDDFEAAGAVTVVVVPADAGPEPLPTPSFLQAVCRQLDRHRLVTTEVYVVPPQYARVCKVHVRVKPLPGYTRLQLAELVTASLATQLHVLTGDGGRGAPFGRQVHIADLIAIVFRTEGVARVDSFQAEFARTKSNASPRTGFLVTCPTAPQEFDRVDLAAEETTSFDATTFTLDTVV